VGAVAPRLILVAVAALLLGAAPARAACDPGPPATYSTGGKPLTGGPVNDPLFPQQWGLRQIKVEAAWARGFTGRGTVIAILDSGVDLAHPDLLPNLLPGKSFVGSCPPYDDNGHGTHTAGIAAAAANNGIGVAGVAPEAKIIPLKANSPAGPSTPATVSGGIRHAADRGADVVSISLATGESPFIPGTQPGALEPTIEEAVEYAWSKGTVVVGAAGNSRLPRCSYPGGATRTVCVTASDRLGQPASYSNAGAEADGTVVVRAPGGGGTPGTVDGCRDNVVATMWPRGDYDSCLKPQGVRGYEHLAGTSMAAPHVAGLVALLAGAGLTAEEIVARLQETAALPFSIVDADAATDGLPVPAPPPPPARPAPSGGSGGGSGSGEGGPPAAPSAADRRCTQARATLRLRERALRGARRRLQRKRTRATVRLVKRRTAARRVAARDVRRRCG
jgi:subtilisin family serine protease